MFNAYKNAGPEGIRTAIALSEFLEVLTGDFGDYKPPSPAPTSRYPAREQSRVTSGTGFNLSVELPTHLLPIQFGP